MKYLLHNAILINRLPEVIPAVEYSPAVPATSDRIVFEKLVLGQPEIPEVPAQPEKYKFFATIFLKIEGAKDGEFIQDKNITFILETTEQTAVRTALATEAQNYININYPEIL